MQVRGRGSLPPEWCLVEVGLPDELPFEAMTATVHLAPVLVPIDPNVQVPLFHAVVLLLVLPGRGVCVCVCVCVCGQ